MKANANGERMGDGRARPNCVTCGKRPRETPYTQCHACRTPMLRAASQKSWETVKRMKAARERAKNDKPMERAMVEIHDRREIPRDHVREEPE